MKQNLTDFFDDCTPEELDALLDDSGLSPALPEGISGVNIEAAVKARLFPAPPVRRPRQRWRAIVAAAACLCLIVAGAVAVEARDYHTAVTFFDANGLSDEGLSRSEIKAVYRDITTETFTDPNTALVLRNSISGDIGGVELHMDTPTPEEMKALWAMNQSRFQGTRYVPLGQYRYDEAQGFDVFDYSLLEKHDGDDLLWSAKFSSFYIEDSCVISDGVLAWGYEPRTSSWEISHAWLSKVDDASGEILWQVRLDHGYNFEYIRAALENDDGSLVTFSRGDLQSLVFTRFTADGMETYSHATDVGNYGIWNAARLGDDYVVQLGNTDSRIVRVDKSGELTDAFTYSAADCDYFIVDMAEFAGRLYLSAYAVPKQSKGGGNFYRDQIGDILDWAVASLSPQGFEVDGEEELLQKLRDNYTAVLLVCDPAFGTPETFFSVPAAMGGELSVGASLTWNVNDFYGPAVFSPMTSSFTIGCSCRVTQFTFDGTGALTSTVVTGETANYAR